MNDKQSNVISDEMRDMTEKSVEQARAAFDKFIDAARRNANATREVADATQSGLKDVSAQGFEYAGRNIDAAFDLAKKLVRAKDPREVLELQADFVRSQFGAMQEQAKELGSKLKGAMDRTSK